jgi:hypothetical protein
MKPATRASRVTAARLEGASSKIRSRSSTAIPMPLWITFVAVSDSTPVDQIWRGAAHERFRDALASDTPPAVCEGCAVYRGTF